MIHKKVELTELFFDLVFVYAISRMTALIHHLHHGVVPLSAFLSFFVALVVLVNTWMLQTVFTNRYGKNSIVNIGFMLVNMVQVLALSNTFSVQWTQSYNFYAFTFLTVGLTAVLLLQYLYEYRRQKKEKDRSLIRFFLGMLFIRLDLLLVSMLFPLVYAGSLAVIVVIATTLSPMLVTKRMSLVPTNFPHLVERLSLLVIILFGEMLIGIAPYFSGKNFSLQSIVLFLVVASLFLFYLLEINYLLDSEKQGVTGNALIYFHYPIFFGLSMITVSLSFLGEKEVNPFFLASFLFTGLALFYGGSLANTIYNKAGYAFSKSNCLKIFSVLGIGFVLSLLLASSSVALTWLLALLTGFLAIFILLFKLNRDKKSQPK